LKAKNAFVFLGSSLSKLASELGRKTLGNGSELRALSRLSANLGRNPLLVQAATGNVSIKIGPKLWHNDHLGTDTLSKVVA